jgi:hypothetical protein
MKELSSSESFKEQQRKIRIEGSAFYICFKKQLEGKGLGIEGQGIVNPIEVVERPRYLGLGYGEVEIGASFMMGSKTSEASNASNGQLKTLQEHFMKVNGASLLDCGSECKSPP